MRYWLMKSEPADVSIDDLASFPNQTVDWYGVRNYQARNNLKAMKEGDLLLWYHSNEGLEIVGIAQIAKEAYQDPTTDDTNWVVVDVKPYKTLNKPVSLATVKADPRLQQMALVRLGRLSVQPVTEEEWAIIMELSETQA